MWNEAFELAVHSAQGALALVLAGLFFLFLHDYRQPYLRHWGLSFLALAAHSALAVAAILLASRGDDSLALLAGASLAALYCQLVLLLAGVYVLAVRRLSEQRVLAMVVLAGIAGAGIAALDALLPTVGLDLPVRSAGRHLLPAGVAVVSAWVILLHATVPARSGARFLAATLVAYAIHLLASLLLDSGAVSEGWAADRLPWLGLGDLVFHAVIGTGLITWLFQQERHAATVDQTEADRLTRYDTLTRLPNRRSIRERMSAQLRVMRDTDLRAVYALVDLARFRRVNDSLGHVYGDELLRTVAARLQECLGRGSVVARLGGDEFAFFLPELRDDTEARARLVHLMEAIREPVVVAGRDIHLDCFCGYALFPDDGESVSALSRAADLAHSRARAQTARQPLRYAAGMERLADERLAMESALRRAVPDEQLRLHYQPIVDRDGGLRGVEALVRWQHPTRGLLGPDAFLPLAATTGLVAAIDYWVLEKACRQAVNWRQDGLDLLLCVNLSANLFETSRLPANVGRLLRRIGLDPACLELEITEQVAMRDIEAGNAVIERLRAVGLRLALDDFGTGYSSMSWLRRLPVDRLKIDRSFIRELDSGGGVAIVRSITELAHAIGLAVTAEGVEDEDRFRQLRMLGCDLYQGRLFGEPMPPEQIPDFRYGRTAG